MEAKDHFGVKLEVGQKVIGAYQISTKIYFRRGTVHKLTGKKVKVLGIDGRVSNALSPSNLMVVPDGTF